MANRLKPLISKTYTDQWLKPCITPKGEENVEMDIVGIRAPCQISVGTEKSLLHLVSFTNGIVNSNCYNSLKIDVYGSNEASKKIMLCESERMQYMSERFQFHTSQRNLPSRYHIAIFNQRKQRVQFYNTCMLNCRPVLESSSVDQTQADKSFAEKMNLLTNAFGSKRKKRAVESRLKNVIDEAKMGSSLFDAMKQSDTSKVDITVMKNAESESLPPKNAAASIPGDVYKLCDIITQEEYNALKDEAEDIKEALDEVNLYDANSKYCHYVTHHLKRSFGSLDCHKTKLLLYFNYLVMLLKLGYKELRQKDPLLGVPETIKSSLFCKFFITSTDKDGKPMRSLPPRMKDKVMAYCVVLALLIDNFSTDLNMLLRDFKVGLMKLTKIAYALGCHVSKHKRDGIDAKQIELKIPLFVPNERSWKRKAKP